MPPAHPMVAAGSDVRPATATAAGSQTAVVVPPVATATTPIPGSFYEISAKLLSGKEQSLAEYRGKVVLVVNTASKCRSTPQYKGLEALYQQYKERGLVILGFPSNEFKQQEPGSAQEIQQFCRSQFGVSFPMFDKVVVKGPDAAPLYRFLAAKHGEPTWNFHKYLLDRNGQVLQVWNRDFPPEHADIHAAIEAALNAKSPSSSDGR